DQNKSDTHYFVSAGSSSGVLVENNLAALHSTEAGTGFISVGGSGSFVDNNYGYMPGRPGSCREPDGGGACIDPRLENTIDRNNAGFMRPRADSLAVDNAAADVPVSDDFHGTPRPQGNAPDIGAVERIQ
ncbi:MAG: choice-of-anchor Q domain-containing protein, partial [Polyangiales bacterium]